MIHHYLKKGVTVDYMLNVSPSERFFMFASMEKELEDEKAKWSAMFGQRT